MQEFRMNIRDRAVPATRTSLEASAPGLEDLVSLQRDILAHTVPSAEGLAQLISPGRPPAVSEALESPPNYFEVGAVVNTKERVAPVDSQSAKNTLAASEVFPDTQATLRAMLDLDPARIPGPDVVERVTHWEVPVQSFHDSRAKIARHKLEGRSDEARKASRVLQAKQCGTATVALVAITATCTMICPIWALASAIKQKSASLDGSLLGARAFTYQVHEGCDAIRKNVARLLGLLPAYKGLDSCLQGTTEQVDTLRVLWNEVRRHVDQFKITDVRDSGVVTIELWHTEKAIRLLENSIKGLRRLS